MDEFLFRLLRPNFWFQNQPTSLSLDAQISRLMDEGAEVRGFTEHTASIGGVCIWTGNYPYAFGSIYPYGSSLPKASTRQRLQKYIDDKLVEQQFHINKGAN